MLYRTNTSPTRLRCLPSFARTCPGAPATPCTGAHIVRFKIAKLRAYEELLRGSPGVQVAWAWLDPRGGQIDQPNRVELLQLADSAASATFAAFEHDTFGNTESRYLAEMSPRLYRRPGGKLTSYGLKMHPWSENARAAYPWVAALAQVRRPAIPLSGC